MQIVCKLTKKPTTTILLDKRRIKKENRYPVKLRLTFNREQRYYGTAYSLTEKEYDRVVSGVRQTNEEKQIKWSLEAYEKKATEIIKSIVFFSWDGFEDEYRTNKITKNTISDGFSRYSNQLRLEGRIGTAVSYECAAVSLEKYCPGTKYSDVSVKWLERYERWMIDAGNSKTTVGIYLRGLRSILNIAMDDKLFPKELYPFGKKGYEIPSGKNIKKALTIDVIGMIYNYPTIPGSVREMAKDYWLFMYLGNGMNVKDMSQLKYRNFNGKFLEFERAKSQRTKRQVEKIQVALNEEILAIIKKQGNRVKDPDNYIFPILPKGVSEARKYQLIQQITGLVNDHIKAICKDLNIQEKVTTYVARHSFATVLKRSGVSTSFIKDALGHTSEATTENYLGSFEGEVKIEAAKALTAWTKPKEIQ